MIASTPTHDYIFVCVDVWVRFGCQRLAASSEYSPTVWETLAEKRDDVSEAVTEAGLREIAARTGLSVAEIDAWITRSEETDPPPALARFLEMHAPAN